MTVSSFRYFIILAICGLTTGSALRAQDRVLHPEAGRSLITNFTPANYEAEPQNWAFIEDNRGVKYAGNGSGVLEYDGITWRQISLANRATVRSLARDASGRIWVGGVSELGYLTSDSQGRTVFVSLKDKVPEAHSNFLNVWNTYATDEGIYFMTVGAIFRWDGSTMKAWPAETNFHYSFVVNGTFYVRQHGIGLMRMEQSAAGEVLLLIPGGERFANTRIYVMLSFDADRILIGTREEGLFLYDGEHVEAFATEADRLLAEGRIYLPGVVLPNGRFGLGTLSKGLVVIDRAGRLVKHVNHEAGLQDNTVFFTYVDRQGNVWLCLDSGIARVGIGSPFTRYGARAGLPTSVSAMVRHDGNLFAGDFIGLKRLHPSTRIFRPVEFPIVQVFSLLPVAGDLLAAGVNIGVYRVVGDRTIPVRTSVSDDYRAITLHQWSRDPNLVLVGLEDGLALLRRSAEGWIDEGWVPGLNIDVWTITEAGNGELWLGTESSRVARVRLPEMVEGSGIELNEIEVTIFGPEDGMVEGVLSPFRVGNKVYITGLGETVFSFDEATGRFSENPIFNGARSGHPLGIFRLREDSEGRVWIATTYGAPVVAYPQADGSYTFEALRQFRPKRITDIYPEADDIMWLMGEDELIRYDMKSALGTETSRPPLIRQVLLGENNLLYGGAGEPEATEIAHGLGAIRFSYAAPDELVQPQFRTQLDGFDEGWSTWSTVTERSYTNIPPGDYRFRVEADGSGESAFQFTVLPPWHQTWWAYGIYILMIGMTLEIGRRILKHRYQSRERKKFELKRKQFELKEAQSKAENLELQAERFELQAALLESEKNQMEKELNIGHRIQMDMLITDFPKSDEIEVYAALKPAREVGGDMYDVFYIDEEHLCCCVGDVSGKGVPAALFMAISKTLIKAMATFRKASFNETADEIVKSKKYSTAAIMKNVNDELSHDNDEYMFVTAFLCIINIKTGHVVYTNAGHNPPYIMNHRKELKKIDKRHGPILGAMADLDYSEDELKLNRKENLIIYTDGVTEAFNESKEMYTEKRLENVIMKANFKRSKDLVTMVLDNVLEFEGDSGQTDDITLMVIQTK